MFVGRIEAEHRLALQAALFAAVLGGKTQPTSLDERVSAFDSALAAEPPVVDREQLELRRALGVR